MKDRYILAVESSCDETSIAVLKNESEILSNVIASQIESHKRFGGVVQFLRVYRHGIESRTFYAVHARRHHRHLVQLLHVGADGKVPHQASVLLQRHVLFDGTVAHGRHHQRIVAGGSLQMIYALVVGDTTERGSLQIDGGKVYGFLFSRSDFAGELRLVPSTSAMVMATLRGRQQSRQQQHADGSKTNK